MRMLLIALCALLSIAPAYAANSPVQASKLCANYRSGTMAIRARCLTKEQSLSLVDIVNQPANCHLVSGLGASAAYGTAGATASCLPGEYLSTWGFISTPTELITMRGAQLQTDGDVAVGVRVVTQEDYPASAGPYTLVVTALCCAI